MSKDFKERRSHWFYGLSPMNIVAILALLMGGGVSWGVMKTKIDDNKGTIENIRQEFTEKINEVKTQVKESEGRTREDIRELRKAIIKEIRK